MSRKDDWNRKHYDYTTLRTKYDIKKRAQQVAGLKGISLNAYVTKTLIKQLRRDEQEFKASLLDKITNLP